MHCYPILDNSEKFCYDSQRNKLTGYKIIQFHADDATIRHLWFYVGGIREEYLKIHCQEKIKTY